MIEIKNLTFQYKNSDKASLRDVNLTIPDGDFVGIIGTSGAGKTTLALSVNGVIPHQYPGDFYGQVLVDGMDTVDTPPARLCRSVGEVFQDIDSQMVASVVEDEILFGMENFGIDHAEIGERLERVLEDVGITSLRKREISSLSGGQKQKVAIASILALEPDIIVLDEPTGELDPESSRQVFGLLQKLNREKGITVIVVEQKIMLLCEYVKHLLVVENGEIRFDGPTREVIANMDAFKELGINIPRVTELYGMLSADPALGARLAAAGHHLPLNVDEAEAMVREVLK